MQHSRSASVTLNFRNEQYVPLLFQHAAYVPVAGASTIPTAVVSYARSPGSRRRFSHCRGSACHKRLPGLRHQERHVSHRCAKQSGGPGLPAVGHKNLMPELQTNGYAMPLACNHSNEWLGKRRLSD